MTSFVRYAVYYVPPEGPLAQFGASWLGWDVERGASVQHPEIAGLDVGRVTETPRKYGFHATLKPPFRLAPGRTADDLLEAVGALASTSARVALDGLELSRIGSFLALVPAGDVTRLNALTARLVRDLDPFRAPPGEAELARRRAGGLTEAQDGNLRRWGYPYVMDEFRFHMTLSGSLADPVPAETALRRLVSDIPLRPFVIDSVSVVGEREDGRFELLHRYALTRSSAASA